jgi:hypothetical protein
MDIKRETSSNKKNWLIELSELTEHERDNFLEFICDDKDGKKLNKAMGLEFAVVSIFYRRDQTQHLNMNIRVRKCYNINVTLHNTNLKKILGSVVFYRLIFNFRKELLGMPLPS